jgi:hypothetical protein
MVCAASERINARSIAGGFIPLPVSSLMAAWHACRTRPLGVGDFRTWLAAHEMVARRCKLGDRRPPAYSLDELAMLLGVTHKRAGTSIRRLQAAGLIDWSDSAIAFPEPADRDLVENLADTIGRGKGRIAIPRRLLRHLVRGARPALVATALAVLLRCLSRRRSGFDGRGRLKATWVAHAFGVSARQVKAARRQLVALGWIAPEPSDQWGLNRWGARYRIDLAWSPAPDTGPRSSPPPADRGATSSPPDLHPEPLRGAKNQEPAQRGPAGVQLPEIGPQIRTDPEAGPSPLSPPRLDDVRAEDLKDTGRLLRLHGQAVARGVVTASEADRLRFVGAAEHALAIGRANPAGLFAYLVRGHCWRYLRQDDEDRAAARLKVYDRGPAPARSVGAMGTHPTAKAVLATDAEIVRAVRAAAIRAGSFRDPFPEFARRYPEWTRERWDRALEG